MHGKTKNYTNNFQDYINLLTFLKCSQHQYTRKFIYLTRIAIFMTRNKLDLNHTVLYGRCHGFKCFVVNATMEMVTFTAQDFYQIMVN